MTRRASVDRLVAIAVAAMVWIAAVASPGLAIAAGGGRVSFTQAQQAFMCTECGEPLNVARSAEAYNENAELRTLIAQGRTLPEIKREMVAQYGVAVLADPPKHGFALLLVVVPAMVVAAGVAVLAVTVPRWRRRAAARAAAEHAMGDPEPRLSDVDAQRLDAELSRQI